MGEERRHNDEVIVERLGNLINSFDEYKTSQKEYHDATSKRIDDLLEQARYTNGKVRGLQLAGAYMKGGLAVIIALVLPMIIWFLNNYLLNR